MATPEEIAWAAGFYEGEGSIWGGYPKYNNGPNNRGRRRTPTFKISIVQVDQEPLLKFQKIFPFAALRGPYRHRNPNHRPYWKLDIDGFEKTLAVFEAIQPWLSGRRRSQAQRVLGLKKIEFPPENSRRRSERMKAMWKQPEFREKMLAIHSGRVVSQETRGKIRNAMLKFHGENLVH